MQRKIKKEQSKKTIGTKAQNAIKLQYESNKTEKKKQVPQLVVADCGTCLS